MKEEVNEFYEAVHLQNIEEMRDEAVGLIRTFNNSNVLNVLLLCGLVSDRCTRLAIRTF